MADRVDVAGCRSPVVLSRRRVLATSTVVVPLVATASCGVPRPLAGPPRPSPDVRALLAAIVTEQRVVAAYREVVATHAGLSAPLAPLLAEHRQHLEQLRGRLVEPPRPRRTSRRPGASSSPTLGPSGGSVPAASLAGVVLALQHVEQGAAAAQLGRLAGVMPSLAQLLASIAASEITHLAVLTSLQRQVTAR